jgi:hypothetical protein
MRAIVHFVGIVGARENTLAAGDTSLGIETKLRFRMLPFWIMAPEAAHGASFEEHRCADARTIVQGKTLYVENNVSSVHDHTVRGESIANDVKVSAFTGRSGSYCRSRRRPSSVHRVVISGFFREIQGGKKTKSDEVFGEIQMQNAVSYVKRKITTCFSALLWTRPKSPRRQCRPEMLLFGTSSLTPEEKHLRAMCYAPCPPETLLFATSF